jgi:hypothetical protein
MDDQCPVALRGVGEPRDETAGLGLDQVALEPSVQLVVIVRGAQANEPVGLPHQLLQQLGELPVAARVVTEDHTQRDVVEQLLPLRPLERVADPQPLHLVGDHGEEPRPQRMHPLGRREHRLVERAAIAPLVPSRDGQRVGLEVGHPLALGA